MGLNKSKAVSKVVSKVKNRSHQAAAKARKPVTRDFRAVFRPSDNRDRESLAPSSRGRFWASEAALDDMAVFLPERLCDWWWSAGWGFMGDSRGSWQSNSGPQSNTVRWWGPAKPPGGSGWARGLHLVWPVFSYMDEPRECVRSARYQTISESEGLWVTPWVVLACSNPRPPNLRRFVPKYHKIDLLGLDALCFAIPCILLSNLLSNMGALVPSNPIRKHLSGV